VLRTSPQAVLFDYGGTLVEEVRFDTRAGNEWMLAHASRRPLDLTIDNVLVRASRIANEVAARREHTHVETPWPAMTKLIYDFLGVRFDLPLAELEIGFWKASVSTRPLPGARLALERLRQQGLRLGVVSNTCFSESVIRYELGKHDLAGFMEIVVVSAEHAVRKPNPLLFDTAAARLGIAAERTWFMGDRLDTDMAGAKAAGMTALWFDTSGRGPPTGAADFAIADWNELAQHVGSAAE
jgi:putative hydrolase of the HAD superfamily